ncbi:MAG TPA: UDP-2,4-diacetamido-2,4,6-trideoxy-beta-L-altropyranose hydrolase [Firmicutes bacterium]|nr:UDP-2,4-diacetamido-2,4,6-trideoxy-beta-L-altropyranose hydrolase [Bacillota bacterium]
MKVFIRADASTQIGTGHVMRCLTLAGDLKLLGMEVSFISRVLPGDLCDYVESKGFKVYRLNTVENRDGDYWEWLTENWLEDARKTQEILLKQVTDRADITNININEERSGLNKTFTDPADTTNISSRIAAELFSAAGSSSKAGLSLNLVVDSYALDSKWEKYQRPYVGKLMVLDDLADRPHDCDLLLDQNYYRNMDRRYEGLVSSACKMLLGPQYALLRPEFHQAKKDLRKRDGKIRRILVFFGGSDPTNETKKALEAIQLLNRPEIAVDVVVGATNPHQEEIKKLCSEMPNTTYHCQVENMAELMAAADLAIGAGGTATWERLYLELPTIAIAVAENQVETLEALGEVGMVWYLGKNNGMPLKSLVNKLKDLFSN